MNKAAIAGGAALAGLAIAAPAAASASPAHHVPQPVVSVTWAHGHSTEIVTVKSDPAHVRVAAIGYCAATGIVNTSGAVVDKAGSVTRTHCARAWWFSVGYETGVGKYYWTYHAVRGTPNLV
jgi:hypothetical protein